MLESCLPLWVCLGYFGSTQVGTTESGSGGASPPQGSPSYIEVGTLVCIATVSKGNTRRGVLHIGSGSIQNGST